MTNTATLWGCYECSEHKPCYFIDPEEDNEPHTCPIKQEGDTITETDWRIIKDIELPEIP